MLLDGACTFFLQFSGTKVGPADFHDAKELIVFPDALFVYEHYIDVWD